MTIIYLLIYCAQRPVQQPLGLDRLKDTTKNPKLPAYIHIQRRIKHLRPNGLLYFVVVLFFLFCFFLIINALGRPYWCVGHFFTQINYLFQKYFRDWTINQLINFSSDSSILSLINPCFWKGTHQYVSQLLFRFINIIPCQYVFFATAVSISLSIIIPLH